MYNEVVMSRFQNPRNAGIITNADGVGQVGNVRSGDIMKMYLRIEKGVITNAKFKTFGGVSAIVATDVACDMIKGRTIDEALKITNQDVLKELSGLPEMKTHCSVLAQEVIADAIKDYHKKLEKENNKKKK